MIAKTSPEFSPWKVKQTHGRFLLNYRKYKKEKADSEFF